MTTVAYLRVSSEDQNEARQMEALKAHGYDKSYTDKASGKDTKRPELQQAIKALNKGDVLLVHSMDRLSRNLADLSSLVEQLTSQGRTIKFLKEGLVFSGEASPMAKLQLQILGAVSEFERSIIRERQSEGIAIAKAKGIYKGRKAKMTPEQYLGKINELIEKGMTKAAVARELGISRETLYQYLRK
jgi:DNA invertase Pin-like site-specific DNA recombinase